MGQAPAYLIIGNGRVARHMRHYLTLLRIPFQSWHRGENENLLAEKARHASHILLLVSDGAIEEVAARHLSRAPGVKIHFSGALATPAAFGAHPLMTFGLHLYDLDAYRKIHFVIDDDALEFEELLPFLPNPHARLAKEKKALYHALCCMAGNFTCILWQKLFDGFSRDLGLPPETAFPYLRRQAENLIDDHATALTGPLARGDMETVEKHLDALEGDPFRRVYEAFAETWKESGKT